MKSSFIFPLLWRLGVALVLLPHGVGAAAPAAAKLKVAVVQMAQAPTIESSRTRILQRVEEAARLGARVVVFPEEALSGEGADDAAGVDRAVTSIREAARQHTAYVLCGVSSFAPARKKNVNWMFVAGPDGTEVFRSNKIYDQVESPLPGIFRIDGIPCNAMICADRWLRGVEEIPVQEGAQVAFELSCNSAREWVSPFEWYWYVPRALRNNVWVVFANTGNTVTDRPEDFPGASLRHGHSAIIAPDGSLRVAARDDVVTILMAEIEPAAATRKEAEVRAANPVLRAFWAAGVKLQRGETISVPAFAPVPSPDATLTLAATSVSGDVTRMCAVVKEAQRRKADAIIFPARALAEADLPQLQAAAREAKITVVVGAEHREGAQRTNAAFVFGPDGALLTRYDQISARPPYQAGREAGSMWFRIKGVAAVVTLEHDGLWSELAELAAIGGARVHVHLENDPANTPADRVRRLQVWSNLASFLTFAATVNVADAMLWDDLEGKEERHGDPVPASHPLEIFSPFSSNLVARTTPEAPLIVATRRIEATKPSPPRIVSLRNPQSGAWLRYGAAALQPGALK